MISLVTQKIDVVNYFNELIETKVKLKALDDPFRKAFGPSYFGMVPKKEISDSQLKNVIKNYRNLPPELQGRIIEHGLQPDTYGALRTISAPAVTNQTAIDILNNLGVEHKGDPERYLWIHIFEKIRSECKPTELITLAALGNRTTTTHAAVTCTQRIAEVALLIGYYVLNFRIVQIPLALFVGYYTWEIITTPIILYNFVTSAIAEKIATVAPAIIVTAGIRLYTILEDIRACAFLGWFVSWITTGAHSRIALLFWKILYLVSLPISYFVMRVLPFAIGAFHLTRRKLTELGQLSEGGRGVLEGIRLQRGLRNAQKIWVEHMMPQRKISAST